MLLTLDDVLTYHSAAGVLRPISPGLFTCEAPGVEATVRIIVDRIIVTMACEALVPSDERLRQQMHYFGGSFYCTPEQLDAFLSELG